MEIGQSQTAINSRRAIISPQRDYYEVLGIARDADQKAIKDAFRSLALKHHPDRNKEPGAEERFKEIAEAYAVLSDPKKRSQYDSRGFAGVEGFSREDLVGGINFEDIFSGLNFDFGVDSLFGGLFRHRHKGPQHGAHVEVDLYVTLQRVAEGGEEKVRLSRPVTCAACHGTGGKGGEAPRKCETCGGAGRVTHSRREEKEHVLIQQITPCSTCHGRGTINEHPCPECQGSGEVEQEETLTVKIPVGVEEGMALRIPGKGMPSPMADGVSGDLFVVVRSLHDPRFERTGADLLRTAVVPLTDAVLGTTLEVPTLNGSTRVTVPSGTQPDTILRLKGKGLPEFGSNRHGDLYVRIGLEVPQRLSHEERELYERLRTIARQTH